ncbi:recombinase family protein [Clostridium botulinum]|uniref:Uncharacterized protein n=1 Tax=Clostridium botulinum TaxID=1491 RepID=A0A6B4JNU1_CLOBO|nr:recombinase family protein [Clostridium botulinum]EES51365.1 Cpp27 [Clostridium botulinum E1 str. 'BoNT E Beluga']MBY6761843.1 recombinase family protein [Clostridium botulinum]MBY6920769.1 recombinase family protein [Clostridium botulinum]MCR1131483.1 recombinase family protein [Clostridium botulinum]NFJ58612.1 hypothetical protein [Clostridium botulinum]
MNIAYIRGNSKQSIDAQQIMFNKYKKVKIDEYFEDFGTKIQIKKMLSNLKENDTLYITSVDRLSRDIKEAIEILKEIQNKKVNLKVLNLNEDMDIDKIKVLISMADAGNEILNKE